MNIEQALFEPYIKDLNPKVIFEFGSYDLTDGIYYRNLWPDAEIFCFEPYIPLYESKLSIAKDLNINFYNYAIGDDTGMIKFHPSNKLSGLAGPSGSLLKQTVEHLESQKPFQRFPDPIIVPIITIKEFCETNNIDHIDFMHIDVEGAVIKVINGFGNIRPGMIRAEVHDRDKLFYDAPSEEEVNNLMTNIGYNIIYNYPINSADILYRYDGN